MWEYGELLRKFLAPEIKAWELISLAREAINLLQVDFALTDDDISAQFINKAAAARPGSANVFQGWPEMLGRETVKSHETTSTADTGGAVGAEEGFYLTPLAYSILNKTGIFRDTIDFLLHEIEQSDLPWTYTVAQLSMAEQESGRDDLHIRWLLDAFRQFGESFTVVGNELVKVNRFTGGEEKPAYKMFKWDTALSRIFFTFLLLGGQEYFGFCAYCGGFYVVQRKGRKKFCSDGCRVAANQKGEPPKGPPAG